MSGTTGTSFFEKGWFAIPWKKADYLAASMFITAIAIMFTFLYSCVITLSVERCVPTAIDRYHCSLRNGRTYQEIHYLLATGKTSFESCELGGDVTALCNQTMCLTDVILGKETWCARPLPHRPSQLLTSSDMFWLWVAYTVAILLISISRLALGYYLLVAKELTLFFGILWVIGSVMEEERLLLAIVSLLAVHIPFLVRETAQG